MEPPELLQHVNILVDDLSKAIIFYTDIVGLKLDDTPDLDFPSQFFKQFHLFSFQVHCKKLTR